MGADVDSADLYSVHVSLIVLAWNVSCSPSYVVRVLES